MVARVPVKSNFRSSFWWLAVLVVGVGSLWAEQLFEDESLGPFKLGQRAEAVVKSVGKPQHKDKGVLWEAIGEWVKEWHVPKHGLTLAMSSNKKGGKKVILNITAEAPCKLATSRGI